MADIAAAPFVNYINGFASGRVDSERREEIELTWGQMVSVDAGPLNVGATITSAMITQALGYQINASITWFSTVTPAVTGNGNTPTAACVLPQTNRPFPFTGLQLLVANYGVNPINCFPHPNDTGNSINNQAANTAVILGPNTITPFQCLTPGIWNAVDIGGGFNGSIETVVSQGLIVGSTTNTQAGATPITQQMVAVSSSQANCAVALPKAKAGTTITVNPTGSAGNTPLNVYPQNGSNDTINGGAANAPVALTLAATSPTIFFCFVDGAWTTK
jgi:hypothetical protein